MIVAYEPIWAIGDRRPPCQPRTRSLRFWPGSPRCWTARPPTGFARAVLYGGSVSSDNAEALLAVPHVDGLFVGRAAWSAAGFVDLLRLAGGRLAQ